MVKVVFMGTPDFSVPVLEGLIENCNVIGVPVKSKLFLIVFSKYLSELMVWFALSVFYYHINFLYISRWHTFL
mgnify:CR=1 FL=1